MVHNDLANLLKVQCENLNSDRNARLAARLFVCLFVLVVCLQHLLVSLSVCSIVFVCLFVALKVPDGAHNCLNFKI